jgi:hypothetical protein
VGVALPLNQSALIEYGPPREIANVCADINNFDFFGGDRLEVPAGGRTVTFLKRTDYDDCKMLVESGLLRCASLCSLSFEAQPSTAIVDDLAQLAYDVASLCTILAQQHVGVPIVSFCAANGQVVARWIRDAIESRYRDRTVHDNLNAHFIAGAIRDCFETHVQMRRSALRWGHLPWYCASISDVPYLEQKFGSLMMALEFFMKNCLLELPNPPAGVEKRDLTELIGCCRAELGWDIPGHYTKKELVRLLRNAVVHGGQLPTKDAAEFRHTYDKWRLFLYRRVLMRLGYRGEVYCPSPGRFGSRSAVGDFSPVHNTFE